MTKRDEIEAAIRKNVGDDEFDRFARAIDYRLVSRLHEFYGEVADDYVHEMIARAEKSGEVSAEDNAYLHILMFKVASCLLHDRKREFAQRLRIDLIDEDGNFVAYGSGNGVIITSEGVTINEC